MTRARSSCGMPGPSSCTTIDSRRGKARSGSIRALTSTRERHHLQALSTTLPAVPGYRRCRRESRFRRRIDLDVQILAGVYLQQCGTQIGQQCQHRHRCLAERGATTGRGALQLVFDDLRDAVDLELDRGRRAALLALGAAETARITASGSSAVRQIAERIAVAADAIALGFEQRVEAVATPASSRGYPSPS